MLSFCIRSWDELSLLVNRLSILTVSFIALCAVCRIWRRQPDNPSRRGVPRMVLVFTGSWLVLLLGTVTFLLLGPCDPLTVLERTIFGASLCWSLGGLTWIVVLGERHNRRVSQSRVGISDIRNAVTEAMVSTATPPSGIPVTTPGERS